MTTVLMDYDDTLHDHDVVITLRLSTGRNAEEKAQTLANHTDTNPTTQAKY